jgi:hypothetical protein
MHPLAAPSLGKSRRVDIELSLRNVLIDNKFGGLVKEAKSTRPA